MHPLFFVNVSASRVFLSMCSVSCAQFDSDSSISAVQVLQGLLAAMALNRALSSVHFGSLRKAQQ